MTDATNNRTGRTIAGLLACLLALALALPAGHAAQLHRLYLPVARQPYRLYLPATGFAGAPEAEVQQAESGLFGPALLFASAAPTGFVTRSGEALRLNGQPYTFLGTNVSYLAGPFFPEDRVVEVVSALASRGVQVLRVFVEPWCDLGRVERLLDLGRQHNVRFILTLEDFYGRTDGYYFKAKFESEGLPHLRRMASRFANRPEVLMWELMNEPTCPAEDSGQDCWDALYRWAQQTSEELKRLDPNHLVATGMQHAGFSQQAIDTFRRIHALDSIDLVSVHGEAGKLAQGERNREREIARELGKPIYVGEAYRKGLNERCEPLSTETLQARAQAIAAEIAFSAEAGIDGYLLWQYAYGGVDMGGGQIQYFCGVYDYFADDPVWKLMRPSE